MRLQFGVLFSVVAAVGLTGRAAALDAGTYQEILERRATTVYTLQRMDDFNGTTLDKSLWQRIGPGRADWDRHMSYRADLVEVKDGCLHLYGKVNNDLEADVRPVLTGGVKTQGKFAMQYGKVEVRCKFSAQKGAWPAIWMMPNKPVRGWPADGEIDILERLNFDPFVYQTVHTAWTQKHPQQAPTRYRCAAVEADTWNVYGFEWTPEALIWTVNGKVTHVYPKTGEHPDQFPWTMPFYLMMDMQLGGEWVGSIDTSTLPTVMLIDWVKFYALP